jgi:hypothetical protein
MLPVVRSEYLALDAVAFEVGQNGTPSRWPFPVVVFELENSRQDDKVAYSLWKVLCVRALLRVIFCYCRDVAAGSTLVGHLADTVVGSLSIQERVDLVGETLLIVGSRAEESTFPYGFFKDWILDKNTGQIHPRLRRPYLDRYYRPSRPSTSANTWLRLGWSAGVNRSVCPVCLW